MKMLGVVFGTFLLLGSQSAFADDAADCESADDAAAISACTRLLQSGTLTGHDLAQAYYHRGQALTRTGNAQAAIADFRQTLTMEPRSVGGFNDLGLALLQLKNNDAAVAAFDRAIALDPKFAVAYGNRGIARQRKNQNEQAIIDFSRAIGIDPQLTEAYGGRGVSYAYLRDFDRAIVDYTAALKIQPESPEMLNNRADAWRNKRVFAKALDDLDHAIRVNPNFAEAYYTRGETYKDMGDRDRALAELHKAIDLDKAGTYRAYGEKLIAQLGDAPAVQTADNTLPAGGNNGGPDGTPATGNAGGPDGNPVVADNTGGPDSATEADGTPPKPAPIGPAAISEKRVALVIGNSAYAAVSLLPNPTRDANLVADALHRDGFNDVIVVHDGNRSAMVEALRNFAKAADTADWAVIYYAGHGIEMAGVNYLIPVDAQLASDRDIPDEAISLDRVLSAVEGAKKLRLVVLDACRNNPFQAKMQVTSASRSVGRGLARVEPSQATLVAYAAKDGSVASDGDTGNSPFAASFAKRVVEAGVEINKVFRLVRSDVMAATDNKQEPFVYGSLPPEDFFFVPPK